jgi:hypothetical protein
MAFGESSVGSRVSSLLEHTPGNKHGQNHDDAPGRKQGHDVEQSSGCSKPAKTTQGVIQSSAQGLSLATWNTTALSAQARRSSLPQARMSMVHSLSSQAETIGLQETHDMAADAILMPIEFPGVLEL